MCASNHRPHVQSRLFLSVWPGTTSLPCAVDAKRTPLNRTFFSWVHPRADRNTHLARPRSVKHRARGLLADFPDCASASARRSPIFAQAAAQRSVASVAQNRPPRSSPRAFLRHRLPAAQGRRRPTRAAALRVRRRLLLAARAPARFCVRSALIGRVLRVADRCFWAVDQVGQSRWRGRRRRRRN